MINDYNRVLRIDFLREIPIVCIHHYVGQGEDRQPQDGEKRRGRKGGAMSRTYPFGDLASATRASKACIIGVAVEVEDVCRSIRVRFKRRRRRM